MDKGSNVKMEKSFMKFRGPVKERSKSVRGAVTTMQEGVHQSLIGRAPKESNPNSRSRRSGQ